MQWARPSRSAVPIRISRSPADARSLRYSHAVQPCGDMDNLPLGLAAFKFWTCKKFKGITYVLAGIRRWKALGEHIIYPDIIEDVHPLTEGCRSRRRTLVIPIAVCISALKCI